MPKAVVHGKEDEKIKKIMNTLKAFGFDCLPSSSLEDIIQSIELDDLNVVVVEDSENSPEVIQLLKNLPMYKRRNLFIVVFGNNLPTMDRLFAFKEGFDLTVNIKDIDNLSFYFKRSYLEYQNLYKSFKEYFLR